MLFNTGSYDTQCPSICLAVTSAEHIHKINWRKSSVRKKNQFPFTETFLFTYALSLIELSQIYELSLWEPLMIWNPVYIQIALLSSEAALIQHY